MLLCFSYVLGNFLDGEGFGLTLQRIIIFPT